MDPDHPTDSIELSAADYDSTLIRVNRENETIIIYNLGGKGTTHINWKAMDPEGAIGTKNSQVTIDPCCLIKATVYDGLDSLAWPNLLAQLTGTTNAETRSDSAGQVNFYVPPGNYTLTIPADSSNRRITEYKNITLPEGQDVDLDTLMVFGDWPAGVYAKVQDAGNFSSADTSTYKARTSAWNSTVFKPGTNILRMDYHNFPIEKLAEWIQIIQNINNESSRIGGPVLELPDSSANNRNIFYHDVSNRAEEYGLLPTLWADGTANLHRGTKGAIWLFSQYGAQPSSGTNDDINQSNDIYLADLGLIITRDDSDERTAFEEAITMLLRKQGETGATPWQDQYAKTVFSGGGTIKKLQTMINYTGASGTPTPHLAEGLIANGEKAINKTIGPGARVTPTLIQYDLK
ncbi:MAG: carboxypeptidase regulatory-like domain-containing protein [Calditrichaeota bacterium]|nr:MAG: carboxypeptidase regulatory-like domain-containing protein [Calditrichota bacterium]